MHCLAIIINNIMVSASADVAAAGGGSGGGDTNLECQSQLPFMVALPSNGSSRRNNNNCRCSSVQRTDSLCLYIDLSSTVQTSKQQTQSFARGSHVTVGKSPPND